MKVPTKALQVSIDSHTGVYDKRAVQDKWEVSMSEQSSTKCQNRLDFERSSDFFHSKKFGVKIRISFAPSRIISLKVYMELVGVVGYHSLTRVLVDNATGRAAHC